MEPFKCDIALIIGDDTYPFTTYFFDHFAVESIPAEGHATVYDLESMWWMDAARKRTVTIKDTTTWVKTPEF